MNRRILKRLKKHLSYLKDEPYLFYLWMKKLFMRSKLSKQIVVVCYHKTGFVLLTTIFSSIAFVFGYSFKVIIGKIEKIPTDIDIVFIVNPAIDQDIFNSDILGIQLIRDPRDIIVSGYLYHKRTSEEWCINSQFEYSDQIMYPLVPKSQEYRSTSWKTKYLNELNGVSYQKSLNSMEVKEGLGFEMSHYGKWTIESMEKFNSFSNNFLIVKFEDLMSNYDKTIAEIFSHLKLKNSVRKNAIKISHKHDLNRKTKNEIENMKHVSSPKTTKWKEYFSPELEEEFRLNFPNVLNSLGYQ